MLKIEDHLEIFLFVGSALIEEQDKWDHNLFEELQMNIHLKNLQNAGWFEEKYADDHPMNYDDGCSNELLMKSEGSDVDMEEDIEATFERVPDAIVRKIDLMYLC